MEPSSPSMRLHLAHPRARGGFTFVELLLVIFVLITAAAGIIGSYLSIHYLSRYARETMMANDDLRDMMERINATAFSALPANFPSGTANAAGYQAIVSGQTGGVPNPFALPGESITVTYPPHPAPGLEILVTIRWTNQNGQRTSSLAGLRTST